MGKAGQRAARVGWLDVAKALGMLLVYYGHFIEGFDRAGVASAHIQQQLIYAFHMPLFFFLSGLFYRPSSLPLPQLLRRRFRRLLVPVLVFNVVGMLIWLVVRGQAGDFAEGGAWEGMADGWLLFLTDGEPRWNHVTWFLVAYFWVVVAQDLLSRWTERNMVITLVAVGLAAGLTIWAPMAVTRNPWYFRSAAAGLVFFQVGFLCARGRLLDRLTGWRAPLAAFASLGLLLVTFRLNPAPLVMMINGSFGDVPLFLFTGLAGSLFVASTARMLAGASFLRVVGTRTLPLLCLNGVLLAFVNFPLAHLLLDLGLARDGWTLAAVSLAYTLVGGALCAYFAGLLERRVPWAVGRRSPA